jgi:hypothetical protein
VERRIGDGYWRGTAAETPSALRRKLAGQQDAPLHVFLRKSAEAIENNRVDFLVSLRVLGPLVLTRTMIALASE